MENIRANSFGEGGCAIPQASSTFAALDLLGYLIHPQDLKPVVMSFTDLLSDVKYFPEFKKYSTYSNFFDSFRDNLRSIMVHRFSLAKYDIAKTSEMHLFLEKNGRQIFNVSFFTKITIKAIEKIHAEIEDDSFTISGLSKDATMEKIKNRIIKLKDYEGKVNVSITNLPTTTTTETTSSLE